MKLIQKKEYFDPNWEAKRLEPKPCLRWYVELDDGKHIGPYDSSFEANNYIAAVRQQEWQMER